MCFFVCLALPKNGVQDWSTIAHGFEIIDATEWGIDEATCGNQDRDSSFLHRSPQVGNLAAFLASVGLGHASLNLGGNVVIYASDVQVKVEAVRYVEDHVNPSHPTVTDREYKP